MPRPIQTERLHATFAMALALSLSSFAARAGDSTPPVITHTPPHAIAGQGLHITAHITDESRIFPQIFFRFGNSGNFEPPIDLKRVKGAKDEYEATLPNKPGPVDYYLECYDEFGNGPARSGSAEAPLHVEAALSVQAEAMPLPGATPDRLVAQPAASAASPAPAPAPTDSTPAPREVRPPAPVTLQLVATPPAPITAGQAALRSLVLPGWGQYRDERRIRGLAFGVATGASLVATLWLQVRAHQANNIYMNAPITVRSQAYDQAVDYADARNTMLGVTIGLWAINVAEAYFLHGTKDPW